MTDQQKHRWIPVDAEKYEGIAIEGSTGEFHVFMSPYDMPEAIRGWYDPGKKFVVIEFKYIGEEETKPQEVDRYVRFFVGRDTNRLYRIEADVAKQAFGSLGARLLHAMDVLGTRLSPKRGRKDNLRVAKEVLAENERELLRDLVPA